jgi:hypothetical protein
MRLRRLVLTFLVTVVVVVASGLPRSSSVIAAGPSCSPAATGIPSNAGTQPTGPLAIEIYTLRIPAGQCHPNHAFDSRGCLPGGDTLPPGPASGSSTGHPNTDQDWIRYGIAVFDTGSSVAVINNVVTQPGALSDTTYLQVCKPPAPNDTSFNCVVPPTGTDPNLPLSLDVRLWGLGAVDALTLGAPLDNPQAEVPSIQVRPSDSVVPTLIGAPVAAQTIAHINYGNIVTRNFGFFSVFGPDMTFFSPGDPAIPPVPFAFPLTRQGSFTQALLDNASVGPRFRLATAVLKNGNAAVANGSTIPSTFPPNTTTVGFLYDTGNSTTLITEDMARALGIDPVNSVPVDCQTLGAFNGPIDAKGFMIDRFEMTSADGLTRYVIHNPLVYVAPDIQTGTPRPAFPDDIAVVVGANYFAPQTVQFDGPGNTLRLSSALSVADVDENGQVNCADLAIVRASFGKRTGQPGFDPRADVNRDGIVNITDLSLVSRQLPPGTRC